MTGRIAQHATLFFLSNLTELPTKAPNRASNDIVNSPTKYLLSFFFSCIFFYGNKCYISPLTCHMEDTTHLGKRVKHEIVKR